MIYFASTLKLDYLIFFLLAQFSFSYATQISIMLAHFIFHITFYLYSSSVLRQNIFDIIDMRTYDLFLFGFDKFNYIKSLCGPLHSRLVKVKDQRALAFGKRSRVYKESFVHSSLYLQANLVTLITKEIKTLAS